MQELVEFITISKHRFPLCLVLLILSFNSLIDYYLGSHCLSHAHAYCIKLRVRFKARRSSSGLLINGGLTRVEADLSVEQTVTNGDYRVAAGGGG